MSFLLCISRLYFGLVLVSVLLPEIVLVGLVYCFACQSLLPVVNMTKLLFVLKYHILITI